MSDKVSKRLQEWQSKLANARAKYAEELSQMDRWDGYYNGSRDVYKDSRTGSVAEKKASNVRNIVYELVESEVDTTVPLPRVEAIHEEDAPLAQMVESMLRNLIQRQHFSVMNDLQERTVPIQGGTFWHVEWNPSGGGHCTLGDVEVSDRHPKQFIPQPGITEMRNMDYMFLCIAQSREFLKRRYGVEVEAETENNPEVRGEEATAIQGLVTQNIAYYRNGHGGIGMFSWVNDQVLADIDDYQARRLERCTKCGRAKAGDVCECGSRRFREAQEDFEELEAPLTLFDGTVIEPYLDGEEVQLAPDGTPLLDENGDVILMPTLKARKIPYYKPNSFPVILRRNVTRFGSLLGGSDVAVIADQQEAVKKFGSKIEEKILKGGSFVTLPEGVGVDTSDEELKILRVANANDKSLIGVINVQPDVTKEMTALDQQYSYAKSTLGITDAFQGKYDSSATSGTAKQFSANQSAGRLQSKRQMKNEAYAELYRTIFQFMLAYSDQAVPVTSQGPDGSRQYAHFNRYDFLRVDSAGELYWDDEFLFTIDPSATLSSNRDALWSQMDLKFQNGAYGPLNEKETLLRYWTQLALTNFPFAQNMKESIAQSIAQEQEMQNALSAMQNGIENTGLQNGGQPADAGGGAGAGAGVPQ